MRCCTTGKGSNQAADAVPDTGGAGGATALAAARRRGAFGTSPAAPAPPVDRRRFLPAVASLGAAARPSPGAPPPPTARAALPRRRRFFPTPVVASPAAAAAGGATSWAPAAPATSAAVGDASGALPIAALLDGLVAGTGAAGGATERRRRLGAPAAGGTSPGVPVPAACGGAGARAGTWKAASPVACAAARAENSAGKSLQVSGRPQARTASYSLSSRPLHRWQAACPLAQSSHTQGSSLAARAAAAAWSMRRHTG